MDKKYIFYYIYDKKLVDISRNIPNIGNRAAVTQSLIAAYNLLSKVKICPNEAATDEDLLSFHSIDYLEFLKKAQISTDLEKINDSEEFIDFNLGYDCPLFQNIYEFAKLIAGSSLTAAKKLVYQNFQIKRKLKVKSVLNSQPKSYLKYNNDFKISKKIDFDTPFNFSLEENEIIEDKDKNITTDFKRHQIKRFETEFAVINSDIIPVSINWFGGWHHAQRDEAGGFCYINDIVIAIQYLLKFYKQVFYIDLDIHHGNGVENAFLFSQRVFTFSLHKYEPGYYPSTGSIKDIGEGNGKFYTVNVPLKNGITDEKYINLFKNITEKIMEIYQPHCIVVQCGADCLAGDPLGGFNLTSYGIGKCLRYILNKKLPTLILGGGGYNIANASRFWTYLTSVIIDCPISNDIPENLYLNLYGPEYELQITPSLRKDENSDEYLQNILAIILQNLNNLHTISDK